MNNPTSPYKPLSFDGWLLREVSTDPVATFSGLTITERPEDAMVVFTTRKGRELQAVGCDIIKLRRQLEENIRVIPGASPPSPALMQSTMRQLEVVEQASVALNERRDLGHLKPDADAPAMASTSAAETSTSEALQRIARNSRATSEQHMHQMENAKLYVDSFLRTMVQRASEARQKQLDSLAKARAAKAAKRNGKSGGPA